MVNYLYWKNRNQYLKLMEDFIDKKINGTQFKTKFFKMSREIQKASDMLKKDFERLITFQPNSKVYKLSGIVLDAFFNCKIFNSGSDKYDYELNKKEL